MRLQLTILLLLVGLAAGTSVRQLSVSSSWSAAAAVGSSLHRRRLAGGGGGKGGTLNSLGLVISSKSSTIGSSTEDRIHAIDAHARHFDHEDAQLAGGTPTAQELLQQQPNRRLAANGGGKGGTLNNLGLTVSTKSSLLASSTADRIRAIAVKAEAGDDAGLDAVVATPGLDPADLVAAGARRRLRFRSLLQRVLLQGGGLGGLGGGFGGGGGNGGSNLLNARDITASLEQRKADAAVSSFISHAVNGDMDVMSAVMARRQGTSRAWEMSLGRDRQQQINGGNTGRKLRLA